MSLALLIKAIAGISQVAPAAVDDLSALAEAVRGGRVLLGSIQKEIADTQDTAQAGSTVIIDVLNDSGEQAKNTSAKVSATLQALRIKVKQQVDDATAATQKGQQDIATSANVIGNTLTDVQTQATDTASSIVDSMATAQTAVEKVFDLYKHGPSGLNLEDYVAHQKDAISKIEGTLFGGYLDQFADVYEKMKQGGASLSPQQLLDYTNSLTGIENIIRQFAGSAGMNFSFDTFMHDLDELMAAQKRAAAMPKNGGKPDGGTQSTGMAGSPTPQGSSASGSLALSNWRGGAP